MKNVERKVTFDFNCIYVTPYTNSVYSVRLPAVYRMSHFLVME